MSTYDQGAGVEPDGEEPEPSRGRWTKRVSFSDAVGGSSFAYRTDELLTTGGEPARANLSARNSGAREVRKVGRFTLYAGVADPIAESELLRAEGFQSQPNHVFFAHCGGGCGGWCPPHPAAMCGGPAGAGANPVYATPVYATPVYATPVYATPVYATPVYATPVYATPVYATPNSAYRTTGLRRSSARPAPNETPLDAVASLIETQPVAGAPHVIVLDTGLAHPDYRPTTLGSSVAESTKGVNVDLPDEDSPTDGYLDPAAGHGTFIAGLITQVAPGCRVTVHRVLSTFGDGDEANIADRIDVIRADLLEQPEEDPTRTVLSLSFGGYAFKDAEVLAVAIAAIQTLGVVVVASAGNDGTCRPPLPAALPNVVSVGAIGPYGPAAFSNYGPWVKACAPGVDLLSTFFRNYEGDTPAGDAGVDPDNFDGWALWSGTSFSAPVVAGALARTMLADPGCTAKTAVERVVEAPALMRIPNLGTVVNVI
jgi:hypothetical protein